MSKWQHRDEGKKISKSVISSKSTGDLLEAKKFLNGLLNLRKSEKLAKTYIKGTKKAIACLLYTSPSPRDRQKSRMPSSA